MDSEDTEEAIENAATALRFSSLTLRFPGAIEEQFLASYQRASMNQIRRTFVLGAFFYSAFYLLDFLMAPGAKDSLFAIRFYVFLPLSALFLASSYVPFFAQRIEVVTSVWLVLAGLGIVAMIPMLPQEVGQTYYAGLIMVLMSGYTWLRIRLVGASILGLVIVAAYEIVVITMTDTPPTVLVSNNFFLVGTNFLAMLACHAIEWYARKDFIKARLLEQERVAVSEVNEHLTVANKQLNELARVDALTGIGNRREFDERLSNEWRRAHRTGEPVALILCDVDFFKRYNDTYGHQAGDECLRQVGGTFRKWARRPADFAARYGGEEFVLILGGTPSRGAVHVAQCVLDSVRALELEHKASDAAPHVTVSAGVAVMVPASHEGSQVLVEMADQALYEAKEDGRDRWKLKQTENQSVS